MPVCETTDTFRRKFGELQEGKEEGRGSKFSHPILIKLSGSEHTARICIEVPVSIRAALRMASIKEDKTQSELATEALVRFFTAPIGSYLPKKGEGSK